MASKTVHYWHKVDRDTLEPLACDKVGLIIECEAQGLTWCPTCKAAVNPEGVLDADGLYDICPFCGEELPDPAPPIRYPLPGEGKISWGC